MIFDTLSSNYTNLSCKSLCWQGHSENNLVKPKIIKISKKCSLNECILLKPPTINGENPKI